jgi:hypothetical protein
MRLRLWLPKQDHPERIPCELGLNEKIGDDYQEKLPFALSMGARRRSVRSAFFLRRGPEGTGIGRSASTPVQGSSIPEVAKFSDVTSALALSFEYVASHTSKKYLIETLGRA